MPFYFKSPVEWTVAVDVSTVDATNTNTATAEDRLHPESTPTESDKVRSDFISLHVQIFLTLLESLNQSCLTNKLPFKALKIVSFFVLFFQ